MALVLVDQAENIVLEAIVNKTAAQSLVLRLFKNNVTPGKTDTEATYTEADFTGYSSIALAGASWGAASGGTIAFAKQTFTSSAGSQNQSVYGYYITQTTSGKLMWAERFSDGPYVIVNNSDKIDVTPTISAT